MMGFGRAVFPVRKEIDLTLWPSIFIGCCVFLWFEYTNIDLQIQDLFYNFQTRLWLIDAKDPLLRLIFYSGPKGLIWIIGVVAIAVAIFYKRLPKCRFARRDIIILAATLATAPALVALGKATTNTFTPVQILRYGGEMPYVKVIESYPPSLHLEKRGRGFPAGHASGGFALMALAGLASTRRGRAVGIGIGLIFGTAMATYQMFKGAHYLSHTLVTAFICWAVFLVWRRIIPVNFSSFKIADARLMTEAHMRLLVIEDNFTLRQSLVQYLNEASFVVDSTGTGDEGLWYATEHSYDAILLDLMLPEIDGMEILSRLRKKQMDVFILVISARDGLEDRIEALNAGADDYLTKPFPMSEALARIHALLRRKYNLKDPVLHVEDLDLDPIRHSVYRAGKPISLTSLEYRLLEYLAFRSGELVTRTDIWEHVFEDSSGGNSNTVDVYIGYLRKKLNTDNLSNLIHTRRGEGFMMGPA